MDKILIFSNQFFNWFFISITGYCYIDFINLILNNDKGFVTNVKNVGTCVIVVITLIYWAFKLYNMWLDHKFKEKERKHKESMMEYEKNKQNILTEEDMKIFLNNAK